MSQEAGFVAHLTKPIGFQTMESTIQQLVLADDLAASVS